MKEMTFKERFVRALQSLTLRMLSRSTIVWITATALLIAGKIDQNIWLWASAVYLGYKWAKRNFSLNNSK